MNHSKLSPSQTRILLAELNHPGTLCYHLYFRKDFAPEVKTEQIVNVLPYVFSGNFDLRIHDGKENGFFQYHSDDAPGFVRIDLENEEQLEEKLSEIRAEPVSPLFDSPLYRLYVITVSGRTIVFGAVSHLICDGTTINRVIPARFDACRESLAEGKELKKYPETYSTYISRLEEQLASGNSENVNYWVNSLKGFRGVGYSPEKLTKGVLACEIGSDLASELMYYQKEQGISAFVLGLSAVFAYYQGQRAALGCPDNEMVWEISIAGRSYGEDLANEPGMFVETLPLHLKWDSSLTFLQLMKNIRQCVKDGLAHSKTSTNEYLPEIKKTGVDPRSLTSFSVVDNSSPTSVELIFPDETDVPFHVRINPNRDKSKGLSLLSFEYNSSVFTQEDIAAVREGVMSVLRQAAKDHEICLSALDFGKPARIIAAECFIDENIRAADAPTDLLCGIRASDKREGFGTLSIKAETDIGRLTAALAVLLVRYGMSKDILIGVRKNGQTFPFGMNVDTSSAANGFAALAAERLEKLVSYSDYDLSCRTDLEFKPYVVLSADGETEIDAVLIVCAGQDGFSLIYDRSRFSQRFIQSAAETLNTLYLAMDSDMPLRSIDISGCTSKTPDISLKNEGTVSAVFDRIAGSCPDRKILIAKDAALTLSELEKRVRRVANSLISLGAGKGERVLILMRRTSNLVSCIFGCVKAGAVFIPMDPDYPRGRIDQILSDSEAKLIITDVPEVAEGFDCTVSPAELLKGEDAPVNTDIKPEDPCFIIYTSGTTGKPKGVVLSNMGITNYIAPEPENAPIYALSTMCSCMLCLSSVSFIVFMRETFGTILNGIPVVLCSEEEVLDPSAVAGLIAEHGIDAMGSTPTRLLQYTDIPEFCEALKNIRVMIIGGESFPERLFGIIRRYSDCEIYNSYGPTEVTIASHQKRMDSGAVSAGFTMLNVGDRICDIDGRELPCYAVGELYVSGAGVALGYYKNEKLNEQRFPVIDGVRYCNTGDLAYRDSRGEVFVLGRSDSMIKLRGLRIEPGEIENVICSFGGVAQAKVIVKEISGEKHLCAFYTVENSAAVTAGELREHLSGRLPGYMVPTFFTQIDGFPHTPNGKISQKKLAELSVNTGEAREYERPVTNTENTVFTIIAKQIGSYDFGTGDDIFLLGLTSLSMIALVSQIYDKFSISVPVTSLIRSRTVKEIAAMLDGIISENSRKSESMDVRTVYPMTASQMGIYFDCMSNPEGIGYHLPNVIRFDGSTDPEKLKAAIIKVIDRHSYLKVSFDIKDGAPVQIRNDSRAFADTVTIENVPEFTDSMAEELAAKPFDITDELLFRFRIFVTPDETVLFSMFHHLIVDGSSLNIIFDDIAAAYDGRELSREDTDGYEYALREAELEKSAAADADMEYYKEQFAVADTATVLTPNISNDENSGSLGTAESSVDTAAVNMLCEKYRISPNLLFISALTVVLTKFISDDKLLLATISNGRTEPAVKNTAALLVKTLPLTLRPDREISIPTLFEYARNVWLSTMSHQACPFTELSGKFDFHPDFFYTYHGKIYSEINLGGRSYERGRVRFDSLRYKMMLNIIEEDKYYIRAEFNDSFYTEDYISAFTRCIADVIADWCASADLESLRIRDISLAPENGPFEFKPVDPVMIHERILNMAKKYPDRRILVCSGESYTYEQLDRKANRIANALRKRGVKDGGSVVLLMPRTAELIISMVGVLKAGAAYIPMDIEYPKERVSYVVEDSGSDLIITDLPGYDNGVSVSDLLKETDEAVPEITVDPDRICYMLYTSGSTGRPKGVEITHKNLSNLFVNDPQNNYFHTREDKPESVLETATVSFDISVLDIMGALTNGIRLIFANDEETKNMPALIELMQKEKPEAFGSITPSRMRQYLLMDEFTQELAKCKMCSVGGEPFIPDIYYKLRSISDIDIYNIYGPTEITIMCNTRIVREDNIVSVGGPLYNVISDIRDIDGKMLPDGVVGEHYVGGWGVTRGYHNLPEKTAAAYITINGLPYFKCGDFAYKLPDGNVIVLGRRDGQIKLRGLRIEIGEIEQSILEYEGVNAVAVVIRKISLTDHLCAYITADRKIDTEELKAFLKRRLTPYMVPTVIMQLETMPYTPNGKIDRKNLPQPGIERSYTAPRDETEEFFCGIFEEALGLDKIGIDDDFFEIGGTSLLAIQLTILASNGGYAVKFRDVFENPTPAKLAVFVSGGTVQQAGKSDIITDYDYSGIHKRLERNTFDNYISGEHRQLGSVLLTGATGFLGSHVLAELLDNTDSAVYCLIRDGKVSGLQRLITRQYYYFEKDYTSLIGKRLFAVAGELTDKESLAAFDGIKLDTVINCAASVKHFSAGSDIYDTNVEGVANILALAEKHGARLVHISTTSTCGEILLDGRHKSFVFDEMMLYGGQLLDNQYLSSKFLAERLVLESAAKGADVKVIRVGNLMARDKDGIFQINFRTNGFINRLRAYITLHAMSYEKMSQKLEMSPIDYTARSIVRLAQTPEDCCLFNCFSSHTINYGDIVKAVNDSGLRIDAVTQQSFDRLLEEAMHDPEKQQGISGLISAVGMGTANNRAVPEVSNTYTTTVLFGEGVYWPALSEDYIKLFIDFLRGLNFWGNNND